MLEYFEEIKEKEKLNIWKREWKFFNEKSDEFMMRNRENNYLYQYVYHKDLTDKMKEMFPSVKMVICIKEFGFNDTLRMHSFYLYFGSGYEQRATIAKIKEKNPAKLVIYTLKAFNWETRSSHVPEEECGEIEKFFGKEIKSLKEFRMNFLFQ
jgi:hypothetical protein